MLFVPTGLSCPRQADDSFETGKGLREFAVRAHLIGLGFSNHRSGAFQLGYSQTWDSGDEPEGLPYCQTSISDPRSDCGVVDVENKSSSFSAMFGKCGRADAVLVRQFESILGKRSDLRVILWLGL